MGSTTTTTVSEQRRITPDPPSPEEVALLRQQAKIASSISKSIDLTSGLFAEQLEAIQPLLDLAAEEAQIRGEVLTPEIQTRIIENEVALREAQVSIIQQQLESEVALEPQRRQFLESQLATAQADLQREQELAPIRDQAVRQQFDILARGGVPTAEQTQFLDEATRRTIEAGGSDIQAFADEQLRLIGQELGPSLGLRGASPSGRFQGGDTPLIDRGQLVGREALRQFGQLQSTARGQEAAALSGLIGANLQSAGGITGLSASLTDAAQRNRIALSGALDPNVQGVGAGAILGQPSALLGQTFGLGLGVSGLQTGIPQTLGSLQSFRAATADQSLTGRTVSETFDPLTSFANILSGAGAAATAFSDIRVKENIEEITVLDKLDQIEAKSFNFIGNDEPRIGVMAQDVEKVFPALVKEIDGVKTVDYGGLAAIAIQAIKELIKKQEFQIARSVGM